MCYSNKSYRSRIRALRNVRSGGQSSYLFIVVCECHVPKGCFRRCMKEVRSKLLRYLLRAKGATSQWPRRGRTFEGRAALSPEVLSRRKGGENEEYKWWGSRPCRGSLVSFLSVMNSVGKFWEKWHELSQVSGCHSYLLSGGIDGAQEST